MEQQLFSNLFLLGFDPSTSDPGVTYAPDMFSKTSTKGFEAVLHFLLGQLFPAESLRELDSSYPCTDRGLARVFRKAALDLVQLLERDGVIPSQTLRASDMQSCMGRRVVVAFWRLTLVAMEQKMNGDAVFSAAPPHARRLAKHMSPAGLSLRCHMGALLFLRNAREWAEEQARFQATMEQWSIAYRRLLMESDKRHASLSSMPDIRFLTSQVRSLATSLRKVISAWPIVVSDANDSEALASSNEEAVRFAIRNLDSMQTGGGGALLEMHVNDIFLRLRDGIADLLAAVAATRPALGSPHPSSVFSDLASANSSLVQMCKEHDAFATAAQRFVEEVRDAIMAEDEMIADFKHPRVSAQAATPGPKIRSGGLVPPTPFAPNALMISEDDGAKPAAAATETGLGASHRSSSSSSNGRNFHRSSEDSAMGMQERNSNASPAALSPTSKHSRSLEQMIMASVFKAIKPALPSTGPSSSVRGASADLGGRQLTFDGTSDRSPTELTLERRSARSHSMASDEDTPTLVARALASAKKKRASHTVSFDERSLEAHHSEERSGMQQSAVADALTGENGGDPFVHRPKLVLSPPRGRAGHDIG